MSELLKEMGQRILERRKQLNMTQETLANLTHLTSQTISYAEMGQKAMRPETMLKICEALGISADYLLRGKILEADTSLLQQKISTLTPSQYRHLEQIIDHFIAAIQEKEEVWESAQLRSHTSFLAISTESRHGAGDQIAGHIINFGCSL